MKYLVTGGAGFIGSNIVSSLVSQGKDVRVADNFSTGKLENLDAISESIEIIEGDLSELDYARTIVDGVDYVIHQAAIPSVPRSIDDPIGNNQAGVIATLNMLVASRDSNVRRMTYASSSSIYGEARGGEPKTEDMLPAPLSPYGVSKLAAEQYCMAFYNVYGFEVVALRYFNVFGPRQDPNSEYSAVIPKFIDALLKGDRPKIYGDGEQTRDFTYVGNIVDANLHALMHDEASGQIFNIAMGSGNSLNDLVDTLHELIGVNIPPVYEDARSGDIRHSYASVDKALSVLKFRAETSVVDGLMKTIDWYRSNEKNKNN